VGRHVRRRDRRAGAVRRVAALSGAGAVPGGRRSGGAWS
jgi:hypothetical protein